MSRQATRGARFLIKFLLYNSVAHLPLILGVTAFRQRVSELGSLRILMYHKVTPGFRPELSVRSEYFKRQQKLLAERFNVISLDQLEAFLGSQAPLPSKAVLLTFDDGYRNNLSEAYPVLKEFGHRALIFIPTDYVGGGTLPHDRVLTRSDPVLSWSELRSMLDVFEVGSHSCSHRILSALAREDAKREIAASKQILETSLGVPVRAFAYPKGGVTDFDVATEKIVSEAGYRFCFTTIPGTNLPGMNPLRLRRYGVEDLGMGYFRRLLDGSADLVGLKDTRFGYRIKSAINRTLGFVD
jgi:peptidoglycan/xylan/chitin deacetylase (PgdA/CDA1 family)